MLIQNLGVIREFSGIRGFAGGVLLSLTLLCSNISLAAQTQTTPPNVLASTRPIHSIVSAVMSGTAAPELLISGSASPHAYALKPSDARKLENAEIVFWVGPELEVFLQNPLRTLAASARVHALSDTPGLISLPIREGGLWDVHAHDQLEKNRLGHAAMDPHFWLDPRNGAAMAHSIAEILAQADPERAELYRDNAGGFATRMAELDAQLTRRIEPARAQDYIVFHDAYQYFEARYGLSADRLGERCCRQARGDAADRRNPQSNPRGPSKMRVLPTTISAKAYRDADRECRDEKRRARRSRNRYHSRSGTL